MMPTAEDGLVRTKKRSFHVGKYFLSRVVTNQEVSLIIP